MQIMLIKNKYTVYDGDGKVVIISCDRSICIAYAKQLKGEYKHG